MRCPNCSAECLEQALECEFCGHHFVETTSATQEPPTVPSSYGRASFTSSEPTYSIPEKTYTPPPLPENPYAASYPSSSKPGKTNIGGYVPNHLVWAILATLFCCLPFGIVAIVYAAKVDSLVAGGDYHGAVDASDKAKMWSWISFGVPVAFGMLYLLSVMLLVAAGGSAK
jgi:Interferon-induced transmembrane protein